MLEKILESPLDCKEIQPVHSEGDQPWDFFGRNDAKAETPGLWPPHVKSWLIGKDSDAGRDWGQEEKGMTEDEMAGWHHWLDGCEFEWTPGVGDGQGGLACCNSWCRKESETTEQLNWTELNLSMSAAYMTSIVFRINPKTLAQPPSFFLLCPCPSLWSHHLSLLIWLQLTVKILPCFFLSPSLGVCFSFCKYSFFISIHPSNTLIQLDKP